MQEIRRQDIRKIKYQGYRVIYRIDDKRLVVLTVRHSGRQFDDDELTEG